MVLYGIVSPSTQGLRDLSPLVAILTVLIKDEPLFFLGHRVLGHMALKVVVVSLPALFAGPTFNAILFF